jgi:hypothetical protein
VSRPASGRLLNDQKLSAGVKAAAEPESVFDRPPLPPLLEPAPAVDPELLVVLPAVEPALAEPLVTPLPEEPAVVAPALLELAPADAPEVDGPVVAAPPVEPAAVVEPEVLDKPLVLPAALEPAAVEPVDVEPDAATEDPLVPAVTVEDPDALLAAAPMEAEPAVLVCDAPELLEVVAPVDVAEAAVRDGAPFDAPPLVLPAVVPVLLPEHAAARRRASAPGKKGLRRGCIEFAPWGPRALRSIERAGAQAEPRCTRPFPVQEPHRLLNRGFNHRSRRGSSLPLAGNPRWWCLTAVQWLPAGAARVVGGSTATWTPVVISALIVSTILATASTEAVATDAPPRWNVNASVLTGSTASGLPGLALGAAAEARRHVGRGPLFGSLRLGWALASGANPNWLIDHHQVEVAAGAGASSTLGAGTFWAQGGAGVGGVYEVLRRHQVERILTAGVPGGEESSLSLGPTFFGEIGVAVQLRGGVSGFLALGPWLFRTTVNGAAVVHGGAFARLGVAYDL